MPRSARQKTNAPIPCTTVRAYYEAFWEDQPADPEPWAWAERRALLLAEARKGERVLDLGCGAGRFVARAAEHGAEPVGVEIAEAALQRARANAPGADLRLMDAGRTHCRSTTARSTSCGAARCSSTSPTPRTRSPRSGASCTPAAGCS